MPFFSFFFRHFFAAKVAFRACKTGVKNRISEHIGGGGVQLAFFYLIDVQQRLFELYN